MNKNLLEKLRKLTAELATAQREQNQDLIEDLEDEIFDLEFEIEEDAKFEYADNHYHRGWQ